MDIAAYHFHHSTRELRGVNMEMRRDIRTDAWHDIDVGQIKQFALYEHGKYVSDFRNKHAAILSAKARDTAYVYDRVKRRNIFEK